MLSLENLREFAKRSQTTERNIMREYIQHLFLASLYKLPAGEELLFKGGTALRIIYNSPRFSEDLDFTGENIHDYVSIEELLIDTLSGIEKQGIGIGLNEAKPTTGGYLGIIHYKLYDFIGDMKFEISLRRGGALAREIITVIGDFVPPYTICHLSVENIVREKMAALISRKKPRDYYDLYFLLRHPELRGFVRGSLLKEILEDLGKEKINFKKELSVLLPISHQLILKDFKKTLAQEIKRYL